MRQSITGILRRRLCALFVILLGGGVCQAAVPADGGPALCGGTTGTAAVKSGEIARLEGLTEFAVEFEHVASDSIPGRGAYSLAVKPEFPSGAYRLTLKKEGAGFSYSVEAGEERGRAMRSLASGPAAPEDAAGLCALLNRQEAARLDGWYRFNTALGCDFMLRVRCAGGGKIDAEGRGGASVLPPSNWHPGEYLRFFSRLAASQGRGFGNERLSAEGTGPLELIAVRFTLGQGRGGIPAGMHDYQIFREGRSVQYSYIYRRTYDDYARVSGRAEEADLAAAKAMLSEQGCWVFDGLSGSSRGEDSFALTASFKGGRELEAKGAGDGIPAAWHEEPWFEFFMRVLESRGGKGERGRLFEKAAQ